MSKEKVGGVKMGGSAVRRRSGRREKKGIGAGEKRRMGLIREVPMKAVPASRTLS